VRVVGQLLHLTVGDTGPGVEPQHLPHLFEPFYRGDKARSSDSGHLGLGLSLVQSHVLALGGQIRVESVPGEGTRFEVILPLGDRGNRPDKASLPPVTCANELS
jgi:signal transduction histidine kinase